MMRSPKDRIIKMHKKINQKVKEC